MVSAFASQLQAIAQKSTHELDLKARRNVHAESLLFDRDVAVKQDFETIYNICLDGYQELCQLDDRFCDFDRNLFSQQAKDQDREQMNKSENEALDLVLKRCITLLGGKILLKPALKALEWLVRRFRIHVYNIDALLHTLLPYHEVAVWANVLAIIPNEKIVGQWTFIRPYLKTTWNVPRHAVAYAAANNDSLFSSINAYVLDTCQTGLSYPTLMRFWSALIVEAITNRLAQTRSGRKEIQSQRTEDLLHKILPLLSEGFETPGCSDLITTCYTITIVLAAKAGLGDHVLDSLLLATAQTLRHVDGDAHAALITMSVLVSHKQSPSLPRKVLDILRSLETFEVIVTQMSKDHSCQPFLIAITSSIMSHIKRRNAQDFTNFAERVTRVFLNIYPSGQVAQVLMPLVTKAIAVAKTVDLDNEVRAHVVATLQRLNELEALSTVIHDAAKLHDHDSENLESLLGLTISLPTSQSLDASTNVDMTDVVEADTNPVEKLGRLPAHWKMGASFLTVTESDDFDQMRAAFEYCYTKPALLETFVNLPIWSSVTDRSLLWQTFLIRTACSNGPNQARVKALQLLIEASQTQSACDIQVLVPYALVLLNDVKAVRKVASGLLDHLQSLLQQPSQAHQNRNFAGIYSPQKANQISAIFHQQLLSLLSDVVAPVAQECILDQSYIIDVARKAMQQNTHEARKSHKQALFTLLTQHALATPLVKPKVVILSMLRGVHKVGGKSKIRALLPILQEWSQMTEQEALKLAEEAGLPLSAIDATFVQLADVHGQHFLEHFAESVADAGSTYRKELILALFDHLQRDWTSWSLEHQTSIATSLFNLAFSPHEVLELGAQNVLRAIDLASASLAMLLQQSQAGSTDVRAPQVKRRKRSSSGGLVARSEALKSVDNATAKLSLVLELVDNNSPELKHDLVGAMFGMLACLKQLQQNRVNSPYLINLCLGSINVMLRAAKAENKPIDAVAVKPELVTDFLRNSDNPQVQNSCLLVLAALSTVVPDRMVHNVMPVFTFIGSNMLLKDDDHSVHVINEAIDKIVPALLENLRRGRSAQSYQSSMATMLASFTSAYEHIPLHRRAAFYQKLLYCINANEFGYMLVALLAHQQRSDNLHTKVIQDLVGVLPTCSQLMIYQQLLHVGIDALATSPKMSATIFNIQKSTTIIEKRDYAESCLTAAMEILQTPTLVANILRLSKLEADQADQVRDQIQNALRTTLSSVQTTKAVGSHISLLPKRSMDLLLQLPSLSDLLEILSSVLDDMDVELRPQALRVLSLQFKLRKTKTMRAQVMAMTILDKLKVYLSVGSDDALLQATLVCVDRIAEAYGRKSPDGILAIAEHILLEMGLYSEGVLEKRLTAIILTMASLVEVLKEGAVPLIPQILTQVAPVLHGCISNIFEPSVYSAICTLLAAVFSHAAFMVSEEKLPVVLELIVRAHMSNSQRDDKSDYVQLLATMARKIELETVVGAILFQMQAEHDHKIAEELLNLLSQSVEASPKSTVVKSAESISRVFQLVLEFESGALKKQGEGKKTGSHAVSDQLRKASVEFVYKVNDTTFRPIFESWIDWTGNSDAGDSKSETASRQTVLFDLLAHFFETLKAIVTSYASYLLKPVSAILTSAGQSSKSATSPVPLPLLANTLNLLKTMAAHDQDSFFAAPSHFDPIAPALMACLNLASSRATRALVSSHVIPTIISFATATIDSPGTHSTLTHQLVQMKSSPSSHVRLASIRALIAMTEDDELGDEFVTNTVGIGAGEGEGARGGAGSAGEIMIYVNEMLEDDDEDVEREVRRWVQMVRAKVGEDVFEV